MFYTYVIKSLTNGFFYKGHCQDLEKRLKEHNSGATRSTKVNIPYQIVYYEEYKIREDAVKREKYFKTAAGRRFLKTKIVDDNKPVS